jgi:hypothetical protein
MTNARRIILILALVAIFVILAQRLDNFTGQPTPVPTVQQQLPEPVVETALPGEYPPPPPPVATAAPQGEYPEPLPPTPTPEGYTGPGG